MKPNPAPLFVMLLAALVPGQASPDVIVGHLPDVALYTSSGSYDAFAIGTTSCNVGNQPLAWVSSTNQHPVIGTSMYVYEGGRFRMVGQSWLKHGFTALQQTYCGPCSAHPNGSALGIGCSDPYSASLNGSQSGLGPKSQVNPSTGYFPYPPSSPSYSGTIARRLQVAKADLSLSNAQWFVEGQYIHPDDAASGNGNNNASWRRASVAGGPNEFTLSLSGPTVQTEPAIRAWGTVDPGVIYQTFQAPGPGGGLFTLAVTRTSLGSGLYRYEYLVHNLNCHDSAGAFTVNFPAGTVLSNAGFHSPPYHSGEPYDNNPWTSATAPNGITWTVDQPFAVNPNSNALRWGTSFNFWFDATSDSPQGASLDYYRVSGSAIFPAPPFPAPEWQTNIANAHMDIDGATNNAFSGPISVSKITGSSGQFNFGARQGGLLYDIGATLAPAVPASLTTPSGQIVNLDLLDPSFQFLLGSFASTTPSASWNIPFQAPPAAFAIRGQLAVLDPVSADGLFLSAANELLVTTCTPANVPLSLGDDTTFQIALGTGSFQCVPSVPFAGSAYTSLFVNSNGSVSFGSGSTDYTATASEFTSQMPRLAGMWTDLNPAAGGTITATTTTSGIVAVAFVNVRQWNSANMSSVTMEFDTAAGSCAIAGYNPSPSHSITTLVGISPGGNAPGVVTNFASLAGLGFQAGSPGAAVYQIVTGGAPQGFNRIDFPSADGSNFLVN